MSTVYNKTAVHKLQYDMLNFFQTLFIYKLCQCFLGQLPLKHPV